MTRLIHSFDASSLVARAEEDHEQISWVQRMSRIETKSLVRLCAHKGVMDVRALEALFVGTTIRLRIFAFCPLTAKTDHTLPVPRLI